MLEYLMTLLHLQHIGVRVPAGMCSARCTREFRSSGCGCGVGRSGPLGAGTETLPKEGPAAIFWRPETVVFRVTQEKCLALFLLIYQQVFI